MLRSKGIGFIAAMLGVFTATALLKLIHLQISTTTVALALLMVVLFTATFWGSRPAFAASILGVLCLNFFFLPPFGTLEISELENWFALGAFLITALTTGHLSSRAKRRAEEAESGRLEIERLYKELNEAFEQSSHAEALKQSEKLKSALLDAVTHDIRTPLTSIKASVTTLLNEQKEEEREDFPLVLDSETRREMLEVINEETDRLNHFVEGLIELAKIEAGEMRLRRQWDEVEEIIKSVLLRAEPLVRHHQIHTEVEKNLPVIMVDSRAVSEVIYTLIDNAAKYSPENSTIRISAGRLDASNVLITVADEGQGIPLHLRERVFDKFFRATRDADISTAPHGTGMGLAIAKGIVEAHGGRIWIADTKTGTRFEFNLPIDKSSESLTGAPQNLVEYENNSVK